MNKVCVFSGSTENLNTSMRIKLDNGQEVEVWISDEYADDATPKKVREAYLKLRSSQDDERRKLMEMAAKLGLQIVDPSEIPAAPRPALVTPSARTKVTPEPTQSQEVINEGARIVSGKVADKSIDLRVTGANSEAPAPQPQYSITSQSKPTEDLKDGEVAEIGLVKGRGGVDIAIPVRRSGKTGTTNVRVVNSGNDQNLQNRFKHMAQASMNDQVNYGKDGYDVRYSTCPLCRGSGKGLDKKECKKCGGLGEIQTSRF